MAPQLTRKFKSMPIHDYFTVKPHANVSAMLGTDVVIAPYAQQGLVSTRLSRCSTGSRLAIGAAQTILHHYMAG
jgi:hypothetical protein